VKPIFSDVTIVNPTSALDRESDCFDPSISAKGGESAFSSIQAPAEPKPKALEI
jgi:hypothetical protein